MTKKIDKKMCPVYPEWTEAQFWSFIRSGLRSKSRRWGPLLQALNKAKKPYSGPNKRQKWAYECVSCKGLFQQKEVAVDHITECGSLRSWEDLVPFTQRLFCGIDGYQVLCKECHDVKTYAEKMGLTFEEAKVMLPIIRFQNSKAAIQKKMLTELGVSAKLIPSNSEKRTELYKERINAKV